MGMSTPEGDGGPGMMADINVTPFVDVMLVLLIIFMVTAPLLTQGVKVALPKVDAELVENSQQEPVVVTVRRDGFFYLNILLVVDWDLEEK